MITDVLSHNRISIMFKFIFWLIVIYLLFRLLVRFVFPFLVRYFVKKSQDKFYEQNPNIRKKKEGEINIDYIPDKNKKEKKCKPDEGEYVDYEELK